MKKFIIRTFFFCLVFFILNLLYLLLVLRFDVNFYKSYQEARFKNNNYEIIFLGNSLTLDGIDSEYLTVNGKKSYNLAMAGASLKTSYIQLEDYLLKNHKPSVVVLGLSSNVTKYFDETTINPIAQFNYGKINWFAASSLPFLKFKWLAVEIIKRFVSSDHRNMQVSMGQLKTNRTVSDFSSIPSNLSRALDSNRYISSEYIEKIDSLCLKYHAKLILLEMPGFRNTLNNIETGPHELKMKRGRNLLLYNFNNVYLNEKLFDPKTDWLGNSHLNQVGARKFTEFLLSADVFNDSTNLTSKIRLTFE